MTMTMVYDESMFLELSEDEMMNTDGGGWKEGIDAIVGILGVNYSFVNAVYVMVAAGSGPIAIGAALGGLGVAVYNMGRATGMW